MNIKNYIALDKLKDGRAVVIRAVRPTDKAATAQSWSLLSEETIYRRYCSHRGAPTEQELKELTEVDFVTKVHLIAEFIDGDGLIIGDASYEAFDYEHPEDQVEIAFTVADRVQGNGLGSILFKHLVRVGMQSGIKHFEAIVLPCNNEMKHIITDCGYNVKRWSDEGELHYDINLSA